MEWTEKNMRRSTVVSYNIFIHFYVCIDCSWCFLIYMCWCWAFTQHFSTCSRWLRIAGLTLLTIFLLKCVFPIISNGLIAFFMIRSDALLSTNMFELNGIAYFMVKLNWIYIERALTKVIFTSWHQMGKIKRGNLAFYIINFPICHFWLWVS